MLTEAQLSQFVRDGAVTIDSGLSSAEIAAASTAMFEAAPRRPDSLRSGRTCDYYDERLLRVISHPWLEAAAKQVLSAASVTFFQTAIINAWPDPASDRASTDLQQLDGFHTDMQYTPSDLHAAPRRMQVSFFLWISDVPIGRANLLIRPGTHEQVSRAWGQRPDTPRIEGCNQSNLPVDFPDLPPATPVVATAGQVTVLTTGAVHSASPNFGAEPRQCFVITFTPSEVEVGLPKPQALAKRHYDAKLRQLLPVDRRHIVAGDPSDSSIGAVYGSEYYARWISEEGARL